MIRVYEAFDLTRRHRDAEKDNDSCRELRLENPDFLHALGHKCFVLCMAFTVHSFGLKEKSLERSIYVLVDGHERRLRRRRAAVLRGGCVWGDAGTDGAAPEAGRG